MKRQVVSKPKRGAKDVSTFCGWNTLEELVNNAPSKEVAGLIAVLFESGCRISEALSLKPDQFVIEDDWLMIYGAKVLKKPRGSPATTRRRNIPIPLNEPLMSTVTDYVNNCTTNKLFNKSRVWCWQQIVKTDPAWWPHRLRSERCCQLVIEYRFSVPRLMKWFNWNSADVAVEYVNLDTQDLKDSMKKR